MAIKLKTRIPKFSRALEKAAEKVIRRTKTQSHSAEYVARARLQAQLKALRQEYRAKEREYIKQFRHDISTLKKQGVIPEHYDARSAIPTSYLEGARNKFADIIMGKSKARKVKSKAFLKTLKESGANVSRGRVILPANEFVRKEQILTKGQPLRHSSYRVIKLDMSDPDELADRIEEIFAGLGPNEYVSFEVAGNLSHALYKNASALLNLLTKYTPAETQYLKILVVKNDKQYFQEVRKRADARDVARAKRKNQRARERRQRKRSRAA